MKDPEKTQVVRCAIYDRVSTDIQAQHGLSLDTQKELLTEYALSRGYEIVDYYVDEGLTARKKLQNRREFIRLLHDIQADKIDLVLVTKLDRWFRNVKDYHNTQAVLEEHHCNWKTVLEDYDTSTADGQLKINIMLAVAQNESDRTSERIKVVFEHKKKNQEHLSGPVPFGYRVLEKRLVKDEKARTVTEDIFQQYFLCLSKRKTIAYIQNRYGEHSPTASQIDRMLSSEIYAGMRYGRAGYCEPYISQEQHRRILSVRGSRICPPTREPYLFSQLMKCPCCGSSMTGFVKKHTCKDGSTSVYKRYRCSRKFGRHSGGACITESRVECFLLQYLFPGLEDHIYLVRRRQHAVSQKDDTWKITSEMERLNFLFQKGRIGPDYYETQYEALERALKYEQEIREAPQEMACAQGEKTFSGNWKTLYEMLDYEHRKCFWKQIVSEIMIDRDTHKVCGVLLHSGRFIGVSS